MSTKEGHNLRFDTMKTKHVFNDYKLLSVYSPCLAFSLETFGNFLADILACVSQGAGEGGVDKQIKNSVYIAFILPL